MPASATSESASPRAAAQLIAAAPGEAPLIAAIDIGGTKIAGALVDNDGSLLVRSRRPTPAHEDAETMLGAVRAVLGELIAAPEWARVVTLGIGCAAPLDTTVGTVSPVNVASWRDFPLVERLTAALPRPLPVVLAADGPAMTAAEHRLGAARGARDALCMVVSTGVGGGLVLGGTLFDGHSGNAGHIGHITVAMDGPRCVCGSRGCVETYASGPSIVRHATANGWLPPVGSAADAKAVAAAVRRGEPAAVTAFDLAGRALGAGIAATATLTEVRLVVIGGGVAASADLLLPRVRRGLGEFATLAFTQEIDVRVAQMGTDAGLVGAAVVAAERLRRGGGAGAGAGVGCAPSPVAP